VAKGDPSAVTGDRSADATTAALRGLLSPDGLHDPYPVYRALRDAEAAGRDIGHIVVRHDQIAEALGDRSMSSERIPSLLAGLPADVQSDVAIVGSTLGDIVAFRDPPDHTRVRRLLAKSFTPRVLAQERAAVERVARHLLDRWPDCGTVDLVAAVTFPLPAMVIAALLGVPDAEFDRFTGWANDIVFFVGSGDVDEALARKTRDSMIEMRAYMADLVARRRRQADHNLLSEMIAVADESDRLSLDEIYANAVFLMTAGHETATNMLTNGVLALLRHPPELARLRAEPALIESATEEMLRFESPVQITARLLRDDRRFHGRDVRAGEALTLVLGAANRDPDVFAEPDRFDITRTPNRHLAFALGPHYCLGASLARLEMHVVVPMLLDRFRGLALASDDVTWQRTLSFRGVTALEVTL
jgi:cytochrome P450